MRINPKNKFHSELNPKRRSTHQRCAVCKKLRKWWMRANELKPGRILIGRLIDGRKACWICQKREKETGTWEYGKSNKRNSNS